MRSRFPTMVFVLLSTSIMCWLCCFYCPTSPWETLRVPTRSDGVLVERSRSPLRPCICSHHISPETSFTVALSTSVAPITHPEDQLITDLFLLLSEMRAVVQS